jgi:ABC-type spermidine/putrescine transport system permease subunit II
MPSLDARLRGHDNGAVAPTMTSADLKLVLPLTALFAAFFIAPLCILVVLSLSTDAGMKGFTSGN